MSYGFSMSFVDVENAEDAMNKMQQFVKWLQIPEVSKAIIKGNIGFSPAFRFTKNVPNENFMDWARKWWINRLFVTTFIYWPEHKILAVVGEDAGEYRLKTAGVAANPVFPEPIYFQNSTDRNYDLEPWRVHSKLFSKIVDNLGNLSVSEYKRMIDWNCDDDEDDDVNLHEYFYKTAVYDRIYKTLNLEDWLYDVDNPAFQVFKINTIKDDVTEIRLKIALEKLEKEEKEKWFN